jgi:hypothetical protein
LIDRDVERALVDNKTNRHEMRRSPRIGGSQMTDPATGQEAGLAFGQHAKILHELAAAGQTPPFRAKLRIFANRRGPP